MNEQVHAADEDLLRVIKESFDFLAENVNIFIALEQDREKFLDQPRIKQLKKMISEVEVLIEEYIKDVDKFGADEVKDVLKLAWDLKQIDLYNLSPDDIKAIVNIANDLHV